MDRLRIEGTREELKGVMMLKWRKINYEIENVSEGREKEK